jgi:hypothetical protein
MDKRLRPLLVAIVAGVMCLLDGAAAQAAPMYSDFATIRAQVRDVVIGTVHRSPVAGLTIDVDKVVQGSASAPSVMAVKDAPSETVTIEGERVLAFVDKTSQLRWVGQLAAGRSIEDGALRLHGFFDFNAHIVSPGIASLAQVKTLLATGALTQTYAATLSFPDGHGSLHRSTKQLTLQYDVITRHGVVTGFAPACLSLNSVFSIEWGQIRLVFTDTCATATTAKWRELTLMGQAAGVDPTTGNILAELTPTVPFLEEHDYDTFVADGSYASVTRVVTIGVPGGPPWSWRIGDGVTDPAGRLHAPGGWSSTLQGAKNVTVETYEFTGAKITFSPAPAHGTLDDDAALVQGVQAGTITSCTFSRNGLSGVPCTLAVGSSLWVKR